jgi:hypothetical protein
MDVFNSFSFLVFNVGEYRRAIKSHAYQDFFDPNNAEAVVILK